MRTTGRNPQRGDAERLQIIEVIDDALPVAALIEPERARHDAGVVVEIAVVEAIDEELIDDLVAPVARRADWSVVFQLLSTLRRVGAADDAERQRRALAIAGVEPPFDTCTDVVDDILPVAIVGRVVQRDARVVVHRRDRVDEIDLRARVGAASHRRDQRHHREAEHRRRQHAIGDEVDAVGLARLIRELDRGVKIFVPVDVRAERR